MICPENTPGSPELTWGAPPSHPLTPLTPPSSVSRLLPFELAAVPKGHLRARSPRRGDTAR